MYDVDAMLASAGNSKFVEWVAYLSVVGEEVKAAQAKPQGNTNTMKLGG